MGDFKMEQSFRFFIIQDEVSGGKTHYNVISKKHGYLLGIINYFQRWGRWVLVPDDDTFFSSDCLYDLMKFINQLDREGKKNG